MRGKVVNFCMALLNLLIGTTIIVYALKIPREITELTVQEYQIINIIKILIYIVFGVTTFLNILQYFLNNRDNTRKTGYLISVFSVAFIFIKELPIAIFSILSGVIIIVSIIKERWVEKNSITAISIIGINMVMVAIIIGTCFIYKNLGLYILNKENENEIAYKQEYFKYITELEISEPYINVQRDGKYGYVNSKGETVIDFSFDYASPFVPIVVYDKNFQIALVCEDGRTRIILKNLRDVLTYRSQSMNEDYESKLKELEDVYYNTLGQTEKMHYEINEIENSIYKIPIYKELSDEYTYIYNYNEEYNLIVTKSNLGFGDTYDLVSKSNPNFKITLECEKLCYDEEFLYIYSNGNIPFYDISTKKQGWFTKYGDKRSLSGKAQIMEIFGDYVLIKNHNDNTIYFIDDKGAMVSSVYKELFVLGEDKFIVKNNKNKYIVINSAFEKVFESEWDFVDTSLLSVGILVFGTSNDTIDFNDYDFAKNMNLKMLDMNGNIIVDNLQQVYNKYYYISGDKTVSYSERYSEFLNNLKVMKSEFVGDEFYK